METLLPQKYIAILTPEAKVELNKILNNYFTMGLITGFTVSVIFGNLIAFCMIGLYTYWVSKKPKKS